jgi:putative ABC transport system permease protein
MLKNYFKIVIRNLIKHRTYSIINMCGLAVGMAVSILILLYVREEMTFDTYHEYKNQIYRIQRDPFCTLAPSFAPLLEKELPEIEHLVRISQFGFPITFNNNRFFESRIFCAEQDIFSVFTIPLKRGNSENALNDPFSIVLSESMAEKYFGTADPMGKNLLMALSDDNNVPLKITGIMKDVPQKSHLHYDFLVPYSFLGTLDEGTKDYFLGSNNFTDNVCGTYVRLSKECDPKDFSTKLKAFLDQHFESRIDRDGRAIPASEYYPLRVMKVTDIHLHSHTNNEFEANGDIRYVTAFFILAIFILMIACINFVNLTTAKANQRAKEIGLRKVIGANRQRLIFQFFGESLFISLFSLGIALLLIEFILPYARSFTELSLGLNIIKQPFTFFILLGTFCLSSLLAGIYPAFYLSAFQPTAILGGTVARGRGRYLLRRSLVVFQFIICIGLFICVYVIFSQMDFIRNKDLGFNKENVIQFPANSSIENHWTEIKKQLLNHSNIISATLSKRSPGSRFLDAPGYRTIVNGEEQQSVHMPHNRVEWDFFKTYGIDIIAGRDFSIEHSTDATEAFIINETAARDLGWKTPEDAIGAPMAVDGRQGEIIGVARDFHYETLHHSIIPVLTYIKTDEANTVSVRLASNDKKTTISYIEDIWKSYCPGISFEFNFLDQKIDQLYKAETRMMTLMGYGSLLVIFIACLGLFGLSSFIAEQRTREIGIRKVLGASIFKVCSLLSREFTQWILFANIIAWPIAYYAINKWLQVFAYRIELTIWPFLLAGSSALVIALLTVSWQAIRAATANPVEALRYE